MIRIIVECRIIGESWIIFIHVLVIDIQLEPWNLMTFPLFGGNMEWNVIIPSDDSSYDIFFRVENGRSTNHQAVNPCYL